MEADAARLSEPGGAAADVRATGGVGVVTRQVRPEIPTSAPQAADAVPLNERADGRGGRVPLP